MKSFIVVTLFLFSTLSYANMYTKEAEEAARLTFGNTIVKIIENSMSSDSQKLTIEEIEVCKDGTSDAAELDTCINDLLNEKLPE